MTDEIPQLKQKLRQYLSAHGHEFINIGNGYKTRCPDPAHEDKNPSAVLYETEKPTPYIHCFGCGFNGHIIKVASLLSGIIDHPGNLPKIKKHILDTIGQIGNKLNEKNNPPAKKEAVKKQIPVEYESLESFKKDFTHNLFHNRFQFLEKLSNQKPGDINGEITGEYIYRNHDLKPIMAEVKVVARSKGKKNVIPFWNNSETGKITTTNPPFCFYGLERYYENKKRDIMIVSGGECVDEGNRHLGHEFTFITAMGGDNKIDKHDWGFLR